MNENIKNYWATKELLDYGYKLVIKRNKKSAKVIIKFDDGEIYTQFKIEKAIGMYFIYDEWGGNITDTFDYTESMDDCIKSCIDIETPSTYKETAAVILSTFRSEIPALGSYARMSEGERFKVWAMGLPSVLDTCYYYNRSAVDDLGVILGESEEEKNQYSEEQAATLLTALIYRELIKGGK